jgi:hypothetical protein
MNNNDLLFAAGDVATFCQVDLKTIHNWVGRNKLKAFRTPGRHLRFHRLDVLSFLRKYGYPVPEKVGKAGEAEHASVMVMHHNEAVLLRVLEALREHFVTQGFTNHYAAALAMGEAPPDVLIVDTTSKSTEFLEVLSTNERVKATHYVPFEFTEHALVDLKDALVRMLTPT